MTAYSYGPSDPTDVVGRRIGAYAIDIVLMAVVWVAVVGVSFFSVSEVVPASEYDCVTSDDTFDGTGFDDDFGDGGVSTSFEIDSSFCFETGDEVRYVPEDEEGAFVAQVYGVGFGLSALNFLVLQGLTGASLGKLILGLRVVRSDGRTAGIGWIALRWLVLPIDALCCGLPGLVLVFTTKGHRRLGDMAAGTFVVRKESVGSALQVPGVTTGYGGPGYPGAGGYGSAPGGWPAPGAQQGWPGGEQQGWPGTGTPQGWSGGGQGGWPAPTGGQPDQGGAAGWGTGGTTGGAHDQPSGEGPTWDPARNAYIQYDRELEAWMQWDDDAKTWRPISQ